MQKNSSDTKLVIKHSGFARSEVFEIKAKNLLAASKLLGMEFRKEAKSKLKKDLKSKDNKNLLHDTRKYLLAFERLVRTRLLVVDGVDYGQRYLDAMLGYSKGVGISLAEAAFLQLEIAAGCQTIFSQDLKTQEIRLIHTEEDDDEGLLSRKAYNYRLVKITLPEKEVTFFAYPGLCGWGPAFGINETKHFVQTVDDLFVINKYPNACIWANAISFMILDAADFGVIDQLRAILEDLLSKRGCVNGYATHMATNIGGPMMKSIEYGGKIIGFVNSNLYGKQEIIAQANYPRNENVKKYSSSHPPVGGSRWKIKDIRTHLEMKYRQKRLERLARKTKWSKGNATNVINVGLRLLANPYGDLARYKESSGEIRYYHTGLPSIYTAAHLVGYVSKNKEYFYIGKLLPKPIPNKRYSLDVNEDYPFAEKKLWEYIYKERDLFYKKNKVV